MGSNLDTLPLCPFYFFESNTDYELLWLNIIELLLEANFLSTIISIYITGSISISDNSLYVHRNIIEPKHAVLLGFFEEIYFHGREYIYIVYH